MRDEGPTHALAHAGWDCVRSRHGAPREARPHRDRSSGQPWWPWERGSGGLRFLVCSEWLLPQVVTRLIHLLGEKILGSLQQGTAPGESAGCGARLQPAGRAGAPAWARCPLRPSRRPAGILPAASQSPALWSRLVRCVGPLGASPELHSRIRRLPFSSPSLWSPPLSGGAASAGWRVGFQPAVGVC